MISARTFRLLHPAALRGARAGLLLHLYLFLCATSFALTPDERFARANKTMGEGDYGEAAYQLREILSAGYWSHGSLHNLGNAEWQVARPGHAMLAWERARSLNPFDRNTVANLRFARTKGNLSQPAPRWHEQFSEFLPVNAWLIGSSLCLWSGVTLLCLPRLLGWRRAGWHQGAAALLLALFLVSVPALAGLWARSNLGIALAEETKLRLTPTRHGEQLSTLPAGELARVEKERGKFFYVRAAADRAGWVDKAEFAKVWE